MQHVVYDDHDDNSSSHDHHEYYIAEDSGDDCDHSHADHDHPDPELFWDFCDYDSSEGTSDHSYHDHIICSSSSSSSEDDHAKKQRTKRKQRKQQSPPMESIQTIQRRTTNNKKKIIITEEKAVQTSILDLTEASIGTTTKANDASMTTTNATTTSSSLASSTYNIMDVTTEDESSSTSQHEDFANYLIAETVGATTTTTANTEQQKQPQQQQKQQQQQQRQQQQQQKQQTSRQLQQLTPIRLQQQQKTTTSDLDAKFKDLQKSAINVKLNSNENNSNIPHSSSMPELRTMMSEIRHDDEIRITPEISTTYISKKQQQQQQQKPKEIQVNPRDLSPVVQERVATSIRRNSSDNNASVENTSSNNNNKNRAGSTAAAAAAVVGSLPMSSPSTSSSSGSGRRSLKEINLQQQQMSTDKQSNNNNNNAITPKTSNVTSSTIVNNNNNNIAGNTDDSNKDHSESSGVTMTSTSTAASSSIGTANTFEINLANSQKEFVNYLLESTKNTDDVVIVPPFNKMTSPRRNSSNANKRKPPLSPAQKPTTTTTTTTLKQQQQNRWTDPVRTPSATSHNSSSSTLLSAAESSTVVSASAESTASSNNSVNFADNTTTDDTISQITFDYTATTNATKSSSNTFAIYNDNAAKTPTSTATVDEPKRWVEPAKTDNIDHNVALPTRRKSADPEILFGDDDDDLLLNIDTSDESFELTIRALENNNKSSTSIVSRMAEKEKELLITKDDSDYYFPVKKSSDNKNRDITVMKQPLPILQKKTIDSSNNDNDDNYKNNKDTLTTGKSLKRLVAAATKEDKKIQEWLLEFCVVYMMPFTYKAGSQLPYVFFLLELVERYDVNLKISGVFLALTFVCRLTTLAYCIETPRKSAIWGSIAAFLGYVLMAISPGLDSFIDNESTKVPIIVFVIGSIIIGFGEINGALQIFVKEMYADDSADAMETVSHHLKAQLTVMRVSTIASYSLGGVLYDYLDVVGVSVFGAVLLLLQLAGLLITVTLERMTGRQYHTPSIAVDAASAAKEAAMKQPPQRVSSGEGAALAAAAAAAHGYPRPGGTTTTGNKLQQDDDMDEEERIKQNFFPSLNQPLYQSNSFRSLITHELEPIQEVHDDDDDDDEESSTDNNLYGISEEKEEDTSHTSASGEDKVNKKRRKDKLKLYSNQFLDYSKNQKSMRSLWRSTAPPTKPKRQDSSRTLASHDKDYSRAAEYYGYGPATGDNSTVMSGGSSGANPQDSSYERGTYQYYKESRRNLLRSHSFLVHQRQFHSRKKIRSPSEIITAFTNRRNVTIGWINYFVAFAVSFQSLLNGFVFGTGTLLMFEEYDLSKSLIGAIYSCSAVAGMIASMLPLNKHFISFVKHWLPSPHNFYCFLFFCTYMTILTALPYFAAFLVGLLGSNLALGLFVTYLTELQGKISTTENYHKLAPYGQMSRRVIGLLVVFITPIFYDVMPRLPNIIGSLTSFLFTLTIYIGFERAKGVSQRYLTGHLGRDNVRRSGNNLYVTTSPDQSQAAARRISFAEQIIMSSALQSGQTLEEYTTSSFAIDEEALDVQVNYAQRESMIEHNVTT